MILDLMEIVDSDDVIVRMEGTEETRICLDMETFARIDAIEHAMKLAATRTKDFLVD